MIKKLILINFIPEIVDPITELSVLMIVLAISSSFMDSEPVVPSLPSVVESGVPPISVIADSEDHEIDVTIVESLDVVLIVDPVFSDWTTVDPGLIVLTELSSENIDSVFSV